MQNIRRFQDLISRDILLVAREEPLTGFETDLYRPQRLLSFPNQVGKWLYFLINPLYMDLGIQL